MPSLTTVAADYFDVVLGERPGFLAVAFGHDPYRDATGRYRHRRWTERRYPWPAGRDHLVTDITRMTVAGERADVYVCPAVRHTDGPRRKGSALSPMVCWSDLDGPSTDPELLTTLDPFTVESGSDGHRHVYVPLTRPVDLGMHARLNKALAARLGGDAKWSDEALLRLPGTRNHKTDSPARVRSLPWSGRRWDPDELAVLLGVDPARPAPGVNRSAPVAAEPAPDPLPELVRGALEHPGTTDRSAAHHRLMGACHEAGLSCGQALTVAAGYAPSREKYGDRLAAEVARSWGKIEQGDDTERPVRDLIADGDDFDERFGVKYFGKLGRKTIMLVKTLAEDIMAAGPLALGIDGRMWAYSGGVWRPAVNVVRDRATRLLGERFHTMHSTNAEAIIRADVPKISCEPVDRYINFRNGLLEWRTGELVSHDPLVLSTLQLPIVWNPDARCPAFDEFLSQVVPEDTIPLMWELIGYMMYDGNPLHKAAMLHGSGRNGKGTFLRVLKALLGEGNVTAVTLQALASERFAPAGLFGKLANIAGDIDGTFIENTARFKAITGGDVITAEFKFRDQFEFTPRAVPIFSANKIPGSADVTVGYLSRWVVLPFPNTFTGKEDRGLDARLSTPAELAGIAHKGVKALRDLMARGNFVETESSQEAFDDFRRKVNQVESWLHECCEQSPEHAHVKRTELFAAYQRWAEQEGFGKLKAREFYDRLSAAGITAAKVHGSRGFNGIKVIDECFGGPSSIWPPGGSVSAR